MVYENIFLSYGISASKDPNSPPRPSFTSYRKPSRILKIWLSNQRNLKKKAISIKLAKHTHINIKRAMSEFPLMLNVLKNPQVQKELRLNEEEIEYINKPR